MDETFETVPSDDWWGNKNSTINEKSTQTSSEQLNRTIFSDLSRYSTNTTFRIPYANFNEKSSSIIDEHSDMSFTSDESTDEIEDEINLTFSHYLNSSMLEEPDDNAVDIDISISKKRRLHENNEINGSILRCSDGRSSKVLLFDVEDILNVIHGDRK